MFHIEKYFSNFIKNEEAFNEKISEEGENKAERDLIIRLKTKKYK